jgi:Trk-type K+ transport system membrane component
VDQSMVPFQRAYPMIFAMIFLILAGNTAFVSIAKLCCNVADGSLTADIVR